MMMTDLTLPIIGDIHSPYKEKFGIPRQPNLVDVEAYIEMRAPYHDPLAFVGIEQFSHLWLLWQFHDNKNAERTGFRPQVRPPRLGGNQKLGVFATRSMYRPSPVGLSVVKLKRVEQVGQQLRVYVSGSDLLDGTPILDIKPYIHYSDAVLEAQSGYAQAQPPRKQVLWTEAAQQQQHWLSPRHQDELEQVLSLDPRPAYQDDPQRMYGLHFANVNVKFRVEAQQVLIEKLEQISEN